MLEPGQLRDIDKRLLLYLRQRAVTPAYCRLRLKQDEMGDYSRGYVQQRLSRLEEHGHVENLLNVGLYELIDDPEGDVEPEPTTESDGAIYDCPDCEWTGDDWEDFQNHLESHDLD